MHFICAYCESSLSGEVRVLESGAFSSEEDQTDYVPSGCAFLEMRSFWPQHQGFWCINAKDTLGMEVTEKRWRTNGCCNLDGCDGPNMLCANCGKEVATAKLDCWMPHCMFLEPSGYRMTN
jgi:hypothetical protein